VPERGRVEDHTVIFVASLDLALAKLRGVFGDPTDGTVGKAGEFGILACAVDDVLRGVDVDDMSASGCGGEGAAAGVGEEVENSWRAAEFSQTTSGVVRNPAPVFALFWEDAKLAGRKGFE
jgi:hypothetical protein